MVGDGVVPELQRRALCDSTFQFAAAGSGCEWICLRAAHVRRDVADVVLVGRELSGSECEPPPPLSSVPRVRSRSSRSKSTHLESTRCWCASSVAGCVIPI